MREMRYKADRHESRALRKQRPTDQWMDGPMDRLTNRQSSLKSRVHATKKMIVAKELTIIDSSCENGFLGIGSDLVTFCKEYHRL